MAATKAMIDYARAIASKLGFDEPDFSNFSETSAFISENSMRYKAIVSNERVVSNLQGLYGDLGGRFTECFQTVLKDISNQKGVYVFWDEEKIVYIGKSVNLQERVYSSLKERCRDSKITHLSLIFTEREADMHILEIVLITEHKPLLNMDCTCNDRSKYFVSNLDLYSIDRLQIFEQGEADNEGRET